VYQPKGDLQKTRDGITVTWFSEHELDQKLKLRNKRRKTDEKEKNQGNKTITNKLRWM